MSMNPFSSWLSLSMQMTRLGFDAQRVIGLRMLKLAAGDAAAQTEAQRMVAEKSAAFVEAQMTLATSMAQGRGHHAAKAVLGGYGRKVRANQRRLSRG